MEPLKYVYDPNDCSVGAHQGVAADPVRMHPHRPTPDLATGYLEVGPEIRLKARGELVGKSLPGGYNLSMDYDAVGNRTGLTDPDGGRFTAVYDALNRLDCVVDPDAKRTTLQYDAGGRRTTLVDGNGVTRAYQYDPAGRPTTQVDYNSGMSPFYTMVDGYDNAGNRTTRQQNGYLWTWVYDVADQLLQQLRSGYRGTYVYDEAGNITLKDHQGYSPITMAYDACNRLTTVQRGTTLETLTYGDSGNLAVDNSNGNRVTYAYDPENRLLSMHNYTGSRYTYAYWADGLRRYAQEPSSPIVTQIWDGQDLLMEKSPTGTARYIAHEGEVFGEKRGDTRYLYVPDPLGSVVALVDNAQAITDSFIYLPYGEEQSRTGSTASYLRWLGRWGYRRDYTNRAYVRARVMRTDFGKWMSEDPIGLSAGDVNLYRYVSGNPMTQVDPEGMIGEGCGRRIQQGLADICQTIGRITPSDMRIRRAIADCFAASWGAAKRPVGCQSPGASVGLALKRLQEICTGSYGSVHCSDAGRCCPAPVPVPPGHKVTCAHVLPLPAGGPPCQIELCESNINQQRACTDPRHFGGPGCPDMPAVGFNLIHEGTHCAGYSHGTVRGDPAEGGLTCNDVLACCIFMVLSGASNPAGCCERI